MKAYLVEFSLPTTNTLIEEAGEFRREKQRLYHREYDRKYITPERARRKAEQKRMRYQNDPEYRERERERKRKERAKKKAASAKNQLILF